MRRKSLALALLGFLAATGASYAGTVVWDVTGQNTFGKLDLNTGTFSQISDFGFMAAGMGEIGSTLYTALSGGPALFKVNTMTGATTLVGTVDPANPNYFAFGSTTTSLYMVDTVGTLWNINPTTGASSMVGSTHVNLSQVTSIALSAGSNALYMAVNSDVYRVDATTGNATLIGSSGSTDFGALVGVNGTIYANSIVAPNSIYMFNPATGVSSFVTLSSAGDYAYGLAPIVPEPASLGFVSIAGVLFAGYALERRRRNKA
jgi:hypothetical protein